MTRSFELRAITLDSCLLDYIAIAETLHLLFYVEDITSCIVRVVRVYCLKIGTRHQCSHCRDQ